MAANPTLHEDLALFRRLLQVMNVVQKEGTLDQCGAPTSSKDCQPVFNSGVKRRRSEIDFQEEVMMTEGSESDDEEEEDGGDDDDEGDDDIQDIDSEEEDTEEDEEEDYEEEDYDEEELLDSDNEDGSSSSESDTLYDKPDDEPTLQFNPPSICPPKPPSSHHPPPLQTPPLTSTESSSPRNNPNLSPPPLTSTSPSSPHNNPTPSPPPPPQPTHPPPHPPTDLRCHDHNCNGRLFTTRSNLQRHRREKSHARLQCRCPRCGAVFSRTTARNTHVASGSCHRIRRYSNGRVRKGERVRDG